MPRRAPRIILSPLDLLEQTPRELTYALTIALQNLAEAKKRMAYEEYRKYLLEISRSLLPYPIVRDIDEKLGISLAWQIELFPEAENVLESRAKLARKLQELTPSDFQEIVNKTTEYINAQAPRLNIEPPDINIEPPDIKEPIELFLRGEIDSTSLLRRLNARLRRLWYRTRRWW